MSSSHLNLRPAARTLFILCAAVVLQACGSDDDNLAKKAAENTFKSAIQVQLLTVESSPLLAGVEISGTVSAFRKATLASELSASVKKRWVEPGHQIAKNQKLLTLDAEVARNAHNEASAMLAARDIALESAQQALTRGRELVEKKFISQDQLDDLVFAERGATAQRNAAAAAAASAKRRLADSELRAPFAGTVEQLHVQEGDYVNPGQVVATLADFSRLRVQAGVSSRQASLYRPGQGVKVSFTGLGIAAIDATVASIGRIADPRTGNYPMEIWLDGQGLEQVREGMICTIVGEVSSAESVVQIPTRAVLRRGGQQLVFIAANGQAELRAIKAGRTTVDQVEIIDGLSEGEQIVIDGQFALRDGATIEAY